MAQSPTSISAFAKPGSFWKGNLHAHSTASDGAYEPAEVCRRYEEAGYDFLALTDHFLPAYDFPISDTRAYRTADFTTIIGAELHTGETEFGSIWHILAVGLPFDFDPPSDDESAHSLAQRALAGGAYVAIAHPAWYGISERDAEALGQVDAIEVFNGVACDHNDRPDSWNLAEILLSRRKRFLVCATDDFHGSGDRNDFSRGWVRVKSVALEPESLLSALKAGDYYSSTGPEIYDLQWDGESLTVECSPAERVFLTGITFHTIAHSGHGQTRFTFDLANFHSPYARITVRGLQGGRAWTNPIWFDDLSR